MSQQKSLISRLWGQKEIQSMVIPGMIFILIFCYGPMYGIVIAFQDYKVGAPFLGLGDSTVWVGLKHFIQFVQDPSFLQIMRNTFVISMLRLLITFPAPLIFALLLNEIQGVRFKKLIQSVSYLPHFVSWVIVGGLVTQLFSINGSINSILVGLNIIEKPIMFMGDASYFWGILIGSDLWKELGWSAIIFLTAMASIDPELYMSASIDGANRWQRIKYVTIPGISSTIVVVFLLTVGSLLMYGFDPIMQLTNNLNNKQLLDTAEVIDTHVLRMGIQLGNYSYATAVGLFRSIISVVLLSVTNTACRKTTGSSLW